VGLRDTDATGGLFYPQQFMMVSEVFEEFLQTRGFSLKELFATNYLMPVVHAEADYLKPLVVDDMLEIVMVISRIGTSSITFHYTFINPVEKVEVGRVQIVHVVVDSQTKKAVPIPEFLRSILEPVLTSSV
jgi:YbgC/YbaW family acyl-CoA thioester hydrolase